MIYLHDAALDFSAGVMTMRVEALCEGRTDNFFYARHRTKSLGITGKARQRKVFDDQVVRDKS